MSNRLLTVSAVLLIALGVWLTAAGVPQAAVPPAATATPSALAASGPPATSVPPEASAPAPSAVPRAIPDGYRVQIPRLGIDLPLREGDSARDVVNQQTPEHAAFHFPGTYLPGDGDNSYIYAHARTGMFLSLWNAREGDEVVIAAPDGTQLLYVVSEVHPRIPPTETSWLDPTGSERLTLQTSTGPRPGDPRFIVVAVRKTP